MNSSASPGPRRPSTSLTARPAVVTRVARAAKKAVLETSGWVLLVAGLAAIPLPGPGLMITFAGLLLLSRRHAWAQRRVDTVRLRALRGAAHSVASWPRTAVSFTTAALLLPVGITWSVSPPAPGWWPLPATWWLPGGTVVGVSQVVSSLVALALLGYSYRRFHGTPEAPPCSSGATLGAVGSAAGPAPAGRPVLPPLRPDCVKGERRELLCRCLCASAA
jgi:hypothetical protein